MQSVSENRIVMQNEEMEFQKMASLVTNKLARYLSDSQNGNGKILVQRKATELADELQLEKYIREGQLDIESFLDTYLANTQHLHHPHYLGHQVAAPHMASGFADFIHGVVNNPMAIYEMGPAAATIEKVVIHWMLEKIGWFKGEKLSEFKKTEKSGDGILTHGGSMANLTALLAARAKIAPEAWTEGTPNNLVILSPDVAHYSISRAVSIMGMGRNAIIPLSVNEQEVLDPDSLYPVYKTIKEKGQKVMAVVANACATSTGLYDPIAEIGHFCRENNLWFHVDGAHGAAALLSTKERHLLEGVELADSIVWDAHKMLRTSALCAAALFREQDSLENTFRQKGSYLFREKDQPGFDLIGNAIECTKEELGTKLFLVLASEGEKRLAKYIESRYAVTREFYEIINSHVDFECPYYPQANILCFRYIKNGIDNDFQLKLQNEIVKRGNFYITSTIVSQVRYLRLSVMNSLTSDSHIKNLMNEIVAVAQYL